MEDQIEEKRLKRQALIAEKRHQELKDVLNGILNKKDDNSISKSIESHIAVINELISKTPKPSIELNQEKVVSSIEKLSKELLIELKKYNERPMVDKFDMVRNQWGIIESVKVSYKK